MSETAVFIVDDDEAVRESLAALLDSCGYRATAYRSAREFLAACPADASGCLLADVRMPDMDGLELQERVAAERPGLAVVIMTGHGEVPIAVRAMKAGAIDFIEKPFAEEVIIACVERAATHSKTARRKNSEVEAISGRLELLTPRERDVLDGLVKGLPNKTIAYDLGISPRTVEIHRARVMEKMQANSLSELVRMALAAGIATA